MTTRKSSRNSVAGPSSRAGDRPPPSSTRLRPTRGAARVVSEEELPSQKRSYKAKGKPRASLPAARSKAKPLPPVDDFVDPTYPRPDEWDDRNVFIRYKTCQLSGNTWGVGDFVHVKGESSEGQEIPYVPAPECHQPLIASQDWTARILHVRAEGGQRVFCGVDWVFTSMKMMLDQNCRNPPHKKTVQFPTEVVLGQGQQLGSIISIQCINDYAKVVHFDEADPLQPPIIYDGTAFYRSRFRPSTDEEIEREEAAAAKSTSQTRKSRMWNARFPMHEFEHPTTCFCARRYIPLPAGSEPMVLCPRDGCKKWFHFSCLDKRSAHRLHGAAAIADLTSSGLDLLHTDRLTRGDYIEQHAASAEASSLTSHLSRLPRDERGIPISLLRAAESSITRGTYAMGIVGNARAVLEAREVYQRVRSCLEAAANRPEMRKRKRGAKVVVEIGGDQFSEHVDAETKAKVAAWMKVFGARGSYLDEEDEGTRGRREDCWVCPECQAAI